MSRRESLEKLLDEDRRACKSPGIRKLESKSQMSSGGGFFPGEKSEYFRMGCKDQLLLPRSFLMKRPGHQDAPLSAVREE